MSQEKLIVLVAGSREEEEVLAHAREILGRFGVGFEVNSNPAEAVMSREAEVFIATARDGNHLPLELAARTTRPVLGVPVEGQLRGLQCLEAAMKVGQMDAAPLMLAIGKAGAINAALLAVSILANTRPALRDALSRFRREQEERVMGEVLE